MKGRARENRLSEDQIGTILDGEPVVGPLRDIQEARNAVEAYDRYEEWDPANESHSWTLPGRYRTGSVVVMGGDEVTPQASGCCPCFREPCRGGRSRVRSACGIASR